MAEETIIDQYFFSKLTQNAMKALDVLDGAMDPVYSKANTKGANDIKAAKFTLDAYIDYLAKVKNKS